MVGDGFISLFSNEVKNMIVSLILGSKSDKEIGDEILNILKNFENLAYWRRIVEI